MGHKENVSEDKNVPALALQQKMRRMDKQKDVETNRKKEERQG